jgi:hypothetical protein
MLPQGTLIQVGRASSWKRCDEGIIAYDSIPEFPIDVLPRESDSIRTIVGRRESAWRRRNDWRRAGRAVRKRKATDQLDPEQMRRLSTSDPCNLEIGALGVVAHEDLAAGCDGESEWLSGVHQTPLRSGIQEEAINREPEDSPCLKVGNIEQSFGSKSHTLRRNQRRSCVNDLLDTRVRIRSDQALGDRIR